jgi:hypothetical protein
LSHAVKVTVIIAARANIINLKFFFIVFDFSCLLSSL